MVRPHDRTYEVTRTQDSAAGNCGTRRRGHVGALSTHSFTPSTNGHSPIVGASRCISEHWILRGGCHLVPACKNDTQSNEATIDILIGELWHLHSHPEPHVCWLAARSHRIGDLSIFALGVARASGILSLRRALSNRTRGACAHRSIRRRVHRLPV